MAAGRQRSRTRAKKQDRTDDRKLVRKLVRKAAGNVAREIADVPDWVAALACVLQYTRERYLETIQKLEAANEDLRLSIEQLQSANEGLETWKDETLVLNEKLRAANAELQERFDDLSWANDDMKNLIDAADIALIFLDDCLNISRYTEPARRIMRLLPTDVGRPIGDLVPRVRYRRLATDACQVLRTLVAHEVEVEGEDRNWYFLRILPHRKMDSLADGVVIAFVDVTGMKALRQDEQRLMDVPAG